MKKLPIGISTLKDIINEDYIYVDKTKIALDLIENGRYYFLSRPRRFGKSLFLDTLKTIFDGEKEIFKDLYIYDKWEFKKYPVIRISWGSGVINDDESFKTTLNRSIELSSKALGVQCDNSQAPKRCVEELITLAYEKYNQKVVILVDEYDKPILDNIDDKPLAFKMREKLKDLYALFKDNDEYLKFVFITGVSKFSKVSLFSGLNNIEDITLNPKYATICGYTQNDVETVFSEHLQGQDFTKIKHWYNGYKFLGEGVYNPFDILLFISNRFSYDNYWFSTATPTFLLKLIEKNNYFLPDLEYISADKKLLDSFDVDNIELETLMWQTGYLTITKSEETYDGIEYTLNIPNQEVRVSLMGSIADFMSKIQNPRVVKNSIYKSLLEADFQTFEIAIKSLFASIPYNNFTGVKLYEYEGYYVSVFYAYMKAFGIELIGEDVTNKGRIDLTLKIPNGAIYVIEFKVDGTNALEQIKAKKYYEKYLSLNLPIYLVGIEFDKENRNVSLVAWETLI